jgi:OOP family OmpA-OmpF porin
MRSTLILILTFWALSFTAQRRPDEQIFLDLGYGVSNAVEPFTSGYRSPTFDIVHANLGFRVLMNRLFGYRLHLGYDQITAAPNSLPFKSTYYRGSAEAVVDLGELLRFKDFTTVFGLFLHGGVGYSRLYGSGKSTGMGHFINGLNVNLYLAKRLSLFFDLTRVNHVYQQVTFDLQSPHNEKGFDGMMFNMSLGITLNFSKLR